MDEPKRTFLDHATALMSSAFVGLYGLTYFLALAIPEPAGTVHDGFMGIVIWPAIGSLYGAAAILQQEYNLVRGWRPSWRQGITLSWVGGWALLVTFAVIWSFVSRGPSAAPESFGFCGMFFIFVVLPWAIARLRHNATSRGDRAFLDQ